MDNISKNESISAMVRTAVDAFASGFQGRHEGEFDDPNGAINMKIHNVFIEALGKEIQYYTALVRSLDSSLGNMLEKLAINIASLSFEVKTHVEGPLNIQQIQKIAEMLEGYKRRQHHPAAEDCLFLRNLSSEDLNTENKRHDSDYYLIDRSSNCHYLIELKIGGDLDNKKARSEKEAILEQYAILSNTLDPSVRIKTYFATAYNRFGENQPWNQERVKQYFGEDELLIGRDFWNFVCMSDNGYDTVLRSYRENSHLIKQALESIKRTYLGRN